MPAIIAIIGMILLLLCLCIGAAALGWVHF
jgi:putative effector of murein hydrolase LrgA (UPF0299 family)